MRRPWLLVVLVLVLATAGGLLAFRLATRESTQPTSVTQAVERFRALPPEARTVPPALRSRAASPGVYVYATRGFEVSHVLGTRRHMYPASTTITVSAAGPRCLRTRWDALATRWDGDVACLREDDRGWRLASRSEEHAFVGHVDRRTYRCTPDSAARPPRLRVGATWRSRCTIEGTTTTSRTVVAGPRTLVLAGRHVRTWLLRTRTRIGGETTGTGTVLTWVLPGSQLPVRYAVDNASMTRTIVGDVAYEERYMLRLRSPHPLR